MNFLSYISRRDHLLKSRDNFISLRKSLAKTSNVETQHIPEQLEQLFRYYKNYITSRF